MPHDCTIIVPTYNRHEALCNNLAFLEKYSCRHHVFIADSSSDAVKALNQKLIKKANLNVSYVPFESRCKPQDKLYQAASSVSTEYAVISADDDFLSLRGLEKAIEYLSDHKDYSVAMGNTFSFWHPGNDIHYSSAFFVRRRYAPRHLDLDDPAERINAWFSPYTTPIFYAVYRTGLLSEALSCARQINDFRMSELAGALVAIFRSNVAYIDTSFSFREKPIVKRYQCAMEVPGHSSSVEDLQKNKDLMLYRLKELAIEYGYPSERISGLLGVVARLADLSMRHNLSAERSNVGPTRRFFLARFLKENVVYRFVRYLKFGPALVFQDKYEKCQVDMIRALISREAIS